jgi:hypothetical protein
MSYSWIRKLTLGGLALLLFAGCDSGSTDATFTDGTIGNQPVLSRNVDLYFATLEGDLSDSQPSRTHRIWIDSSHFTLPSDQGLLKLTVERERDKSVSLSTEGPGFERVGDGLLGRTQAGSFYDFEVEGQGAYRILVSLAGDMDGDGDVDAFDLARLKTPSLPPGSLSFKVADLNGDGQLDVMDADIARQNLGASTHIRPLEIRIGLDPSLEPYSALGETLESTASFLGRVSPGASVVLEDSNVLAQAVPITVDENGDFFFQAPMADGENLLQVLATDQFGQRSEAAASVSRLDQPSEPPASIDVAKRNRIWLLDVHANNYLFRGPLPLTSLDEDGLVDFPTLIQVINQRLLQQGAPIATLPNEFKFTEIVLITNRSTTSRSHGDEGFALHQIYKTILGSDPPWPPADNQNPTSLFTRPLDNEVIDGPVFSQSVGGTTYTIHPSVTWQPISANSTGQKPTTLEGGLNGYQTILKSTFPIVSIAPDPVTPQRHLSNPLSNVSVATRYVQQLMQPDNSQDMPHIYYLHCINGHDRTGMVATAYVLSAYGQSFDFDLATAHKYGQMGAYLPDAVPPGIEPNRNFWDKIESDNKNTGRLKKKYMQAVRALAYFYHHPEGAEVPERVPLATHVPDVPLWNAGFVFADPATIPILETPADYLHVRAEPAQ